MVFEKKFLGIASLCETFTGIIDNVTISYGEVDPNQMEAIILEELRIDLCFKQNLSPKNANIPKLQILERRLKVSFWLIIKINQRC